MATRIETAQGCCPQHGTVEGQRVLPKLTVPLPISLISYLVRARAAKREPFTCPQCERALTID
jgi:hypothetical protein